MSSTQELSPRDSIPFAMVTATDLFIVLYESLIGDKLNLVNRLLHSHSTGSGLQPIDTIQVHPPCSRVLAMRAEVFRQIQWNPTPCCYDHRQGQSLDFRVGPFYLPSEQLTYSPRFWLARGAPYPGPHYLRRCQWSHTVLRLTPWVCASYWRTTGVYHDNFDDTEWQTRFELRVVQPYRWFAGLTRRGICVPLKFRIFGSYIIMMNRQHRIYILELPLSFEIIGRFLMCLLRDLISNPALFLKIRRFDYII